MRQSFYGKIRSEGYDVGTEQQVMINFYLNKWKQADRPTPVLEPMCGTGLNLIPFIEAGADIDGLDSSPYMLAICRKKCVAKGLKPNLHQQFLEEISLPRQYGFMLTPGRSFAHIYDKAVAQTCLQRLGEHLLPGGWFVLDVKSPPRRGEFGEPGEAEFDVADEPDGSTIFRTTVWGERENGRILRCWNKYEKYVEGRLMDTEVFDYNERFYDHAEFEEMLQSAGFVDISATRGYDDTEPAEHDTLVFSSRKF